MTRQIVPAIRRFCSLFVAAIADAFRGPADPSAQDDCDVHPANLLSRVNSVRHDGGENDRHYEDAKELPLKRSKVPDGRARA